MDFIISLPESSGYTAILNIVCRLTGMRHLTPCTAEVGSEDLAWLYLKEIWRLHRLPLTIISDRGPQFISKFWKALCQRLKIKANLSTAYHPETDGKTERLNAITEQYLRAYTSYLQDDWADWLPIAEFAGNAGYSETTKTNAFLANYGYNPRLGFEGLPTSPRTSPQLTNTDDFVKKMDELHSYIRTQITEAQAYQEAYKNKHRTPAPSYKPGDLVYLSAKNLATRRPSKKLDWKNLGPYPVKAIISSHAYKLELPPSLKIHPVFHVSLLSPASKDPIPGHYQDPPPPVIVDNEEEFVVEAILDSKRVRKALKYLVKWTGYDIPTWEPYEHVKHLKTKLQQFHDRHPEKPKA